MKDFLRGIDISKHNIVEDWDMVKDQVDFVILRAGGCFNGNYKDPKFEGYYNECKKRGIPVGAYYDAGKVFIGTSVGKEYAQHFLGLLSGKQFEMPVYVDIEVTPKKFRTWITDAAIEFCKTMEDHRYFVGIYGSDISTFAEALEIKRLEAFCKWVARYGNKKPSYVRDWHMWQYSSTGSIKGIKGNVDLDYTTINFPKVMKGVHLNGY